MSNKAIGGSDISAICGTHPYKTPYLVWCDKTSDKVESVNNEHTKFGNILEDLILKTFSEKLKLGLGGTQRKFVSEKLDYCLAYVDAIAFSHNPEYKEFIVSAKNTSKEVDPYMLPNYWVEQINWEMGLSGIHEGYITWLSKGYNHDYSKVVFDADLFDEQLQHAEYFWTEFVLKNIAPPPFDSSDIVSGIIPKPIAKEADNSLVECIGNLREAKSKILILETEQKKYEEQIKMFLIEADTLTYNNDVIVTWKQNKYSVELDKKELEATYPDIYNQFLKEKKGARVMLLKNVK